MVVEGILATSGLDVVAVVGNEFIGGALVWGKRQRGHHWLIMAIFWKGWCCVMGGMDGLAKEDCDLGLN